MIAVSCDANKQNWKLNWN